MLNRRDNTARSLGFSSFYSLAAHIHIQTRLGKSGPELARDLGKSDRHFPLKFISLWNMEKCLEEVSNLSATDVFNIRDMYVNETVSITKLSEIKGLEVPTIRYALSDIGESQSHSTLYRRLLQSEDELIDTIIDDIVQGKTIREVVLERESSTKPIHKYIEKAIRKLYFKCVEKEQASR